MNVYSVARAFVVLSSACLVFFLVLARREPSVRAAGQTQDDIHYTADGSFRLPKDYREWVFLSSGVDMSYNPKAAASKSPVFDNVFASPAAYRGFKANGTWPDKTVLILEIRGSEKQRSLNARGQTQGRDIAGVEVHLKDSSRFPGGWAFFDVDNNGQGRYLKPQEDCYKCHREHAAVNTTFAQFYPTLLPIAEAHQTVSAAYLADQKILREPATSK